MMNKTNTNNTGTTYTACVIEAIDVGPSPFNPEETQMSVRLRSSVDGTAKFINYTLGPKYNERNVASLREVGIECPDELTPTAAVNLDVRRFGVTYTEKIGDNGKPQRYMNRPGKAFVNDKREGAPKRMTKPPQKRTRSTETPF